MKRFLLIICTLLCFTGCGKSNNNSDQISQNSQEIQNSLNSQYSENNTDVVFFTNTVPAKLGSLNLQYANQYSVDYYEEGYIHIRVMDGTDYVIVAENKEDNSLGLTNPVYIHRPCNNIYLAASSAMDLFLKLDALDSITACSTLSKDYSMEEVKKAIDSEQIKYIGKYSAPDYESLLERKCTLAIESTMISHSPKIKEQIERIGIPVFVERSSYEDNPIGRLEWIKLYGILADREQEAEEFFDKQLLRLNELLADNSSDSDNRKSVVFFSILSNGYVTVRKPGDYICKMIEMAGGKYALDELLVEEDNALSTINIGMEDFYREAHDADILIYNGSIDGGVNSLDELVEKNALLKDFEAVKNGNTWSTGLNMFQDSSKIVEVIVEMSKILDEDKADENQYLKRLE